MRPDPIIVRGKSYVDGNDTILMYWRGFEAAWPAGHGDIIHGVAGNLIYDECRAIQTSVYHCTAVIDPVITEGRATFREGYMPWVVKGPPSIEEYIAAIRWVPPPWRRSLASGMAGHRRAPRSVVTSSVRSGCSPGSTTVAGPGTRARRNRARTRAGCVRWRG